MVNLKRWAAHMGLAMPPKCIFLLSVGIVLFLPAVNAVAQDAGSVLGGSLVSTSKLLPLAEVLRLALARNRTLAQAADDMASAEDGLAVARADFDFKLSPGGNVSYADAGEGDARPEYGLGLTARRKIPVGLTAEVRPGLAAIDDSFTMSLGVSLTQPLFRGGGRNATLAPVLGAEYEVRGSRRALLLRRVRVVLDTVAAAYDAVLQREAIRIDEESAGRLRAHAEGARAKEKMGIATPSDTYRATLNLRQTEDTLASLREARRGALDRLKDLLALPPGEEVDVEAPLRIDKAVLAIDEAADLARANRVELDQSRDAVRDRERQVRLSEHNLLPELNLVVDWKASSADSSSREKLGIGPNTWGLRLETRTDWSRVAEKAAYQESLRGLEASRRELAATEERIIRETQAESRNLEKAIQRIGLQEEQVKLAENQLELARVKFLHGRADNVDVIEAENDLRRARQGILAAEVEYLLGTYRLRAAIGTLIEKPDGMN